MLPDMLWSINHKIQKPNMLSVHFLLQFTFINIDLFLVLSFQVYTSCWINFSSWLLTFHSAVNWLSGARYCFALSECSKESNHCFSLAYNCCWFEILRPLRFLSKSTGTLVQWWNRHSFFAIWILFFPSDIYHFKNISGDRPTICWSPTRY